MRADHDDAFATAYDRENAASLLNGYDERPAMLELIGPVDGLRILDAGCGSGPLTAALRERGALMTGFDGSPAMIALAQRRLGDGVPLHVLDLAEPLPFHDAAFDGAVASLALHYLEDWTAPLAELHRVLAPGGRLTLSVNHPTVSLVLEPGEDSFAMRQHVDVFEFDGAPATLTFWHRPLHAMSDAFAHAGFRIVRLAEPRPAPDAPHALLPPRIRSGERSAFLSFLLFSLERA